MADNKQTTQNAPTKEEKNDKKASPSNSNSNSNTNTNSNTQENKDSKDLDGNQVWVSAQKRPPFYGNIALRMLAKHDTVELHGLGNAIAAAVEVSQYIIPTGKATLQKITTSTVQTSASRKPEVVIILQGTEKAKIDYPDVPKQFSHTVRESEDEDEQQ